MEQYKYTDAEGSFRIEDPELTSYLYFPVAGESGVMSSITPLLGGDSKTGQNTFLLEPVSSENLHNNKSSRNFWLKMQNGELWSATGVSSRQQAEKFTKAKEETVLEAGIMWHMIKRKSAAYGLTSEVTTFVPHTEDKVELTMVTIENIGKNYMTATPVAAIPIYARSADNIRDHRNVTSMLHRIITAENGVIVNPALTFDERGHRKNAVVYGVFGRGGGRLPIGFIPTVEDFIGEGGDFENPGVLYGDKIDTVPAGAQVDGFEAMGGIVFEEFTLNPGERISYVIALGYGEDSDALSKAADAYLTEEVFAKRLKETKEYWNEKVNISYESGDDRFDKWMYWVNFQPILRRIYGCSFLPHHDYGKGGRGWRDLWQDCLALLMMNPSGVKEMLLSNFGGVRMDGTNATIIGKEQGEFIADRNGIARVWMDHGMWPFMTSYLYIKQSGDLDFMLEETGYFKDAQGFRGEGRDESWAEEQGCIQKTAEGDVYRGTILEHILLQHLTAFYDVGEHNHMRLRGADWNDALDMAPERGESVAFTAAYAGNMEEIADLLLYMQKKGKVKTVALLKEMEQLLCEEKGLYDSIEEKKNLLKRYCNVCGHTVSGERFEIDTERLAENLRKKAGWLKEHIRKTEWLKNSAGCSWYNSYYDNNGNRVEGDFKKGVRMMLTGQVFTIMSGTAQEKQIEEIVKSADEYLYAPEVGGYRLNTNFGEIKADMGRMFGFAYGQKENGAVFSHMTIMYANALYKRGFVKEGYKAVKSLYSHASDVSKSKIYPGIPEYIDPRGRGVYHYLTGSASWLLMTVLTEMYGIKGEYGSLKLEPKLMAEQFDKNHEAAVHLEFGGRKLHVKYLNPLMKSYGEYEVKEVIMNGQLVAGRDALIGKEYFASCKMCRENDIVVVLR